MTRRYEIFEVLCDYAEDHVGNSPSFRDLLAELKKRGYKMTLSTLRIHITKLEAERVLERRDGKLIVIDADWIRPDS